MTTRINGREFHAHTLPSEGMASMPGRVHYNNSREYNYHTKVFKNLDEYLATTPGTEKAQKRVQKIRRT